MSNNINLSPGRTWVTGESVTAEKMNTALTGATTVVNDIDTGSSLSSGGEDVYSTKTEPTPGQYQLNFKGLKGGTAITLSTDGSDITINNDNGAITATNTSSGSMDLIDIGTKRIGWWSSGALGSLGTHVISIPSGFSQISHILVSTTGPGSSASNVMAQLVSFSAAANTVTVFLQQTGGSGAATSIAVTLNIFGEA